jgi:hypothetical protein
LAAIQLHLKLPGVSRRASKFAGFHQHGPFYWRSTDVPTEVFTNNRWIACKFDNQPRIALGGVFSGNNESINLQ